MPGIPGLIPCEQRISDIQIADTDYQINLHELQPSSELLYWILCSPCTELKNSKHRW